jgi:hypothetical protein
VRWLSALLGTACVPLAYAVGRRHVAPVGGWVAALAVAFGPVYIITGRIVYPDALQSFLLLVNLLAVGTLLDGSDSVGAHALFASSLFLLLNVKLTSTLYVLGLFLFVALVRRDMLRRPWFVLSTGLGCCGFLPSLIWNAAHGWVGFGWAFFQGQGFGLPPVGLWPSLRHAVNYVSPPLAVLAWLAVPSLLQIPGSPARPRNNLRLLWCVSACLLLPVLASAANSPRNLGLGLLAVWPLAGSTVLLAKDALSKPAGRSPIYRLFPAAAICLAGLSLVGVVIYGTGTVAAMTGPTALPGSGAVPAIVDDVAGWPELVGDLHIPPEYLLYAVDYSIAGQIQYYTGRPVFTSAGQYRLWGIPDFDHAVVISRHFVPPDLIAGRLADDFARIRAYETLRYPQRGRTKTVHLWWVEGRRVPVGEVVGGLDYLGLMRAALEQER